MTAMFAAQGAADSGPAHGRESPADDGQAAAKKCDNPGQGPKKPGQCPDPLRHMQWNLDELQVEEAWAYATGKGVIVAVVDSGIDPDHPEFAGRILWFPEANFKDPEVTEGPSEGVSPFGLKSTHGTRNSGILGAAAGNGEGIHGVAPGIMIMPVRVLGGDFDDNVESFDNSDAGSIAKMTAGIRFAMEHGAQVISMSWGLSIHREVHAAERMEDLRRAVDEAWEQGVVLVAAAGNDAEPYCQGPASHPRVICVSAVGRNGEASLGYSRDALGASHIMAPSGTGTTDPCEDQVVMTMPPWGSRSCGLPLGYTAASGTSIATPHVSGIAALLVELGLTNAEIVDRILCTADDLGEPGRDPIYGYGRVNALRAVTNDRNEGCVSGAMGSAPVSVPDAPSMQPTRAITISNPIVGRERRM